MNAMFRTLRKAVAAAAIAACAYPATAAVVYNTWTANSSPTANVIVTVTKSGSYFNWSLTIDPWNAEALGLFVDFGDKTMPTTVNITNVTTSPTTGGNVSLFAKDTTSNSCGSGCNLNGSPAEPIATPDREWELVFRLGDQGYDGYQTFSWTTEDFGLTEADFGLMAYRTQVNCPANTTLPGGNCTGSQKGYGYPGGGGANGNGNGVPEPASLALVGLGLLGAAAARRRRNA